MIKVYCHPCCSTCKKALKWFADNSISITNISLLETPPTITELQRAYEKYGKWGRVFNTSGIQYREENWKVKINELENDELFVVLSENGMLVKRPFIVTENDVITGFKIEEYLKIK